MSGRCRTVSSEFKTFYIIHCKLVYYFVKSIVPCRLVHKYSGYNDKSCLAAVFFVKVKHHIFIYGLPLFTVFFFVNTLRVGIWVILTQCDYNIIGSVA